MCQDYSARLAVPALATSRAHPRPADIFTARETADLTQFELGELLYASRRTVQDWEAGKRNMQVLTWEYWCLLLNYPEVAAARAHWLKTLEPSKEASHDEEQRL